MIGSAATIGGSSRLPSLLNANSDLHEGSSHCARQPPPPRLIQLPILFPRRVAGADDAGDPSVYAAAKPYAHRLGSQKVPPPCLGLRALRYDHQALFVARVLHG